MKYIISHHDADGIISAYLLKRMEPNAKVLFQDWMSFGLRKNDAILKQLSDAEEIYVADLGSDKETLECLQELSFNNATITLIDHHPSDVKPLDYATATFRIIHNQDNCTAGLIYEMAEALGKEIDNWFKFWTGVAIVADVADQSIGGKTILDAIKNELPYLFWERSYWSGKTEFSLSLASSIGAMLNTARRLAYHYGAYVALQAIKEMEGGGLDYAIRLIPAGELEDVIEEAKYPHMALLKRWYGLWLEKRSDVFKANRIVNIVFERFGLSIINHPWDVSGYVCNVKCKDKPWFAINYGVPAKSFAALAGRGEGLDLNLVMKILEQKTNGKINGGGHKVAVGGAVSRELSINDVINYFQEAVNESLMVMEGIPLKEKAIPDDVFVNINSGMEVE